LTQADVSNPPAAKYTVITTPPIAHPSGLGIPATTSRIQPSPINCDARMKIDPTQSSAAMAPRTRSSYLNSR
jgi:hypothetical protein